MLTADVVVVVVVLTAGVAVCDITLLLDVFVVFESDAVVATLLFVVVLIVSVELFVDGLLLLFACVKLPLITFRGNGFGLIISTIKEETK